MPTIFMNVRLGPAPVLQMYIYPAAARPAPSSPPEFIREVTGLDIKYHKSPMYQKLAA
jgi:hypothetical protein